MAIAACHQMTTSLPATLFTRIAERFGVWRRRRQERAELARLEDRDLRDLGLSRAVLEFELRKPFWRD